MHGAVVPVTRVRCNGRPCSVIAVPLCVFPLSRSIVFAHETGCFGELLCFVSVVGCAGLDVQNGQLRWAQDSRVIS